MDSRMTSLAPSQEPLNPASRGDEAFGALARFIFGGNSRQEKMAMTTPVFSSTRGAMQVRRAASMQASFQIA